MNLKEGTRRLALLLGLVGAISAGFVGYMQLQTDLSQRVNHKRFESLANSDVVQQEHKLLRPPGELDKQDVINLLKLQSSLPYGDQHIGKISSLIDSSHPEFASQYCDDAFAKRRAGEVTSTHLAPVPSYCYDLLAKKFGGHRAVPYPRVNALVEQSDVNTGGIKTIHWTKDHGVESIETEDGQTLYPTPAPAGWMYFLIALFPILGFFIPWGAVRAIVWVGAGFVAGPK